VAEEKEFQMETLICVKDMKTQQKEDDIPYKRNNSKCIKQ
jgi:hypothetical protein